MLIPEDHFGFKGEGTPVAFARGKLCCRKTAGPSLFLLAVSPIEGGMIHLPGEIRHPPPQLYFSV